jgi:hypothetical protein
VEVPLLRIGAFAWLCWAVLSAPVRADELEGEATGSERAADASEAQGAVDAECIPSCRRGFVCVAGACVSACNPPCAAHERCTEALECVSREPPAAYAPASPPSPSAPQASPGPQPESQQPAKPPSRRGPSIAAGLEFGWATSGYPSVEFDNGVAGTPFMRGNIFTAGSAFQFDYGVSERVFIGLRLGLGRVVNSENDSSIGLQVGVGPSVTVFASRAFFLGFDVFLNYLSFDEVGASVHTSTSTSSRIFDASVDGDSTLGIALALRLGFVIEVNERIAITPELKLWGQAATFKLDGASARYHYETPGISGTGYARGSVDDGFFVGTALFIGTRFFL